MAADLPMKTQIHPRNEVDNMKKGTVIKPYWGFKIGETIYIYIAESDLTFKPCINIYRTEDLSSFVVTTWDMDMLKECVKLD